MNVQYTSAYRSGISFNMQDVVFSNFNAELDDVSITSCSQYSKYKCMLVRPFVVFTACLHIIYTDLDREVSESISCMPPYGVIVRMQHRCTYK